MIEIIDAVMTSAQLVDDYAMQGEYFEILEAQYPVDVYLLDRSGVQLSVMRRSEASFFARPGRFEHIRIESAQPQTVRFMVGSGDVGTRRISSTVQVIDGGRSRTLAGVAFIASAGIGSSAGNFACMGLANPAGSGVRLVINSLMAALTASGNVGLLFGAGVPAGTVATPLPKVIGGAAVSKARKYDASQSSYPGSAAIAAIGVQAAQTTLLPLTEPIMVLPGNYILMKSDVDAAGLSCLVQFYEESLT